VPIAIGSAALLNASGPWAITMLVLCLVTLLSSVLGVVYRRDGARAFWLGFSVFGWGTYLQSAFTNSNDDYNYHYGHYVVRSGLSLPVRDDPGRVYSVRDLSRQLCDHLLSLRKAAPKSVGEKIHVLWGSSYYPASITEKGDGKFKVRYDGDVNGSYDEWVGYGRMLI